MTKLDISKKELQEIGLKLIGAAPTAKYMEINCYSNSINFRVTYPDESSQQISVPLLKEVTE